MKFSPLSTWTTRRFNLAYAAICLMVAGVLAPIAHHLLLAPDELRPWNPSYEESYWTPAQAQIATERLSSDIARLEGKLETVEEARVRLAVLKSKVSEMESDSDVGRLMRTVQGYQNVIDQLNGFVQTAAARLDSPTPTNLNEMAGDIAELRPLLVEFGSNARTLETEAKLRRDAEIRKSRRLLMSAFIVVLFAAQLSVWLVLMRLRARERELATNLSLLEARQKALDEAMEMEQARNTFLGKVSHEINSPLQATLTNTQLLGERYSDVPGIAKIVGRIHASVTQLHSRVQDLLDVSEIKNGTMSLRLATTDVLQVFTDVISVQQTSAENKNLPLLFAHSGLVPLRSDSRRLSQVLTNLITNAIRNTDHGAVRVSAHLGTDDHKSRLVITVEDTGSGIPPEVEARLFQPFIRASNSRRGTGLGLAIVKGLVDQLGGDISYTTEAGKGTTFVVRLPVQLAPRTEVVSPPLAQIPGETEKSEKDKPLLTDTPETAAMSAAASTVPFEKRRRVLFLEDDESIRDTIGDLLMEWGYNVHLSSTVAEANQCVLEERYDCIILDMELPDGMGLDTAKYARQTRNFQTPLMAMSAYHDLLSQPGTEILKAALKKPVAIDDLRRTVESLVDETVRTRAGELVA
jgi:signal transduction histidine kinase/ActR/RegA family two-component response regulator